MISAANVKTLPITRTFACAPYLSDREKTVFTASLTTLKNLLNSTTFFWIPISWRTGRTVDPVAPRRYPVSIATNGSLITRNVGDTSTVLAVETTHGDSLRAIDSTSHFLPLFSCWLLFYCSRILSVTFFSITTASRTSSFLLFFATWIGRFVIPTSTVPCNPVFISC